MKKKGTVISIIGAAVALAAIVTAVVIFWDDIIGFLAGVIDKCKNLFGKKEDEDICCFTKEEKEDFADI